MGLQHLKRTRNNFKLDIISQPEETMQNDVEEERKASLLIAYKELAWKNQEKSDLAYAVMNLNKMIESQKKEIERLISVINSIKRNA